MNHEDVEGLDEHALGQEEERGARSEGGNHWRHDAGDHEDVLEDAEAGAAGTDEADEADGAREAGESDGADDDGESDGADDDGESDGADDDGESDGAVGGGESDAPTASRRRRPALAVASAAVILVGAAVGYLLIVPITHTESARLARLVPTKSGVAGYEAPSSGGGVQPSAQSGIAALVSAAKKSPSKAGIYSIGWSDSNTSGAGLVVLLLPNDAQAKTALGQVVAQHLSATTYSSDSLVRQTPFSVPGIPGSTGAEYVPRSPTGQTPGLTVTVFQRGREVVLAEVFNALPTKDDAISLTHNEYTHLDSIGSGFTLSVTRYPVVATLIWAGVAVLLALVVSLGPAGVRRRAARRQRRIEEELAHRVVVRGQVITKYRR